MSAKKLAIIQARMTSSRLPGKVMLDIAGKPNIQHMFERLQASRTLDGVLLATTTHPSDDVLVDFCRQQGYACFRGSLNDVLDRCYQAAVQFQADVIVRLTADCPLIDPQLLDLTVQAFLGQPVNQTAAVPSHLTPAALPAADSFDFAANRLPPPWRRTLPIGLDVEVCSMDALQRAWQEARQPHQREHVLPYLYEGVRFQPVDLPQLGWYVQHGTTPRGFRVALLNHYPDYGSLRWTVDTPDDLEFVRQVFSHFGSRENFTWQNILALLEREPELAAINAAVKHKSAFDVDQRNHDS